MNFNQIVEEHKKLENELLQKGIPSSQNDTKKQLFVNKIDVLLGNIIKYSAQSETFEEYQELSALSTKWSGVLSTFFEEPRFIKLSIPTTPWKSTASKFLSEVEVTKILDKQEKFINFAQAIENPHANPENKKRAKIYFASEVIEGNINFANRISSNSYKLLEEIWLKDVKELQAFYKSKAPNNPLCDKENYLVACKHIREGLLINPEVKGISCEFDEAKKYLLDHYVERDNKSQLKPHDDKNSELHRLISRKADRVKENTGKDDKDHNWYIAETYVKMFYENIIPAVLEKSEEKTLRVLKSFQFSKANRFFIINCFETALAIYFLDEGIITDLWDKAEKIEKLWNNKDYKQKIISKLDANDKLELENIFFKNIKIKNSELETEPESSVKSNINSEILWSENFKSKIEECQQCKKRFWVSDDRKRIGFDGVMLNVERKALLKAVDDLKETSEKSVKYKQDINKLYVQSRIIHRDTTL